MKKFFTLFVLALLACINAAAQFVPEDGKQYVIKDTRSDYYIVLAVGNDSQASDTDNTTQASLGVNGTPFTFTPSGMGFVLSTDEGKYLGIGARPWNVGTTSSAVWTVNNYDENGICNIYLSTTSGKGLGVDNHTIGSGIYTDKSGQYWQIVEYVAPEETHHVTATLDGETTTMLEDGEGGYLVTYPEVQTGDHTVVVSYDGEETSYSFTTTDFTVNDVTVSVGKVTVAYKDGEITVTGDGVGAPVGPVDPVDPIVPTTTFKGIVTHNLTSVSSLEELEGIQLTFVDAEQVSVLEEGDGIYVQNENGNEIYAIWHPGFGGTYEVNGNVVTLLNFFSDNSDGYFDELPTGKAALYFEDYGSFTVSNADEDWDGYFQTFSVDFEGAPAIVPFELVFRNNNVVCENGKKVEANEAGVGADFYLVNEGLTAVGNTATLYKDGSAMSFVMTLVDATAISFLGGSSLITEPGTYLLEVPEGTYVDAAGNPSVAFYGQWVVIEKPEPTVWNGNIAYSEASSIEDLSSNFTVEFEEAASVAASGYDVLGVVYEGVEPYAIVMANGVFDVFGAITFEGSKAKVNFQKIADLDIEAQAAAKAAAKKIGAFEPQADKASVVFAAKSFVVDGDLVADVLCNEYEFSGSTVTAIETIATDSAAQIFDLLGRRVRAAHNGIFLVNGKKLVK